jgi:hypothetical protein
MRLTKRTRHIPILTACILLLSASQSWALDGYQDRRGTYVGGGLGGAMATSEFATPGRTTGLESSTMGLELRALIGSGIREDLALELQLNYWNRSVESDARPLDHHHLNAMATLRYWAVEGLYVSGGVGLAAGFFDAQIGGAIHEEFEEMGVALNANVGYELFVSGSTAASLELGYLLHAYDETAFNALSGLIAFRWY